MTEDDADYIISVQRLKSGKSISFEDYLKKHGYELVVVDGKRRIKAPDGRLLQRRRQ